MKFSFKITATALVLAAVTSLSCKKSTTQEFVTAKETISSALGKQLAMDLYRSVSGGVKNNNILKTDASQKGKTAVNTTQECGLPSVYFTDSTGVHGDTTRAYKGKTIFTSMCNGVYNNNWNVDAYLLADTLKTTEKGNGFSNIYDVTLNYDVRALDYGYRQISINGVTTTSSYKSKISNGVVTESHKMETVYSLLRISAFRTAWNPKYVDGRVYFSTKTLDTDSSTGAKGVANAYNGYMEFYSNDTMKAFFDLKNGSYKVFQTNLLTGETKEL
ncbi:hypothetical protein ACFQZI_01720 [Mucilaginibacter lutimaris]|uniref:Lipoprotein n=1 Tax=Mucilaginibacter lutimaris TaxID=931629 RepID=A0ABW2Z9R0_9SPHI